MWYSLEAIKLSSHISPVYRALSVHLQSHLTHSVPYATSVKSAGARTRARAGETGGGGREKNDKTSCSSGVHLPYNRWRLEKKHVRADPTNLLRPLDSDCLNLWLHTEYRLISLDKYHNPILDRNTQQNEWLFTPVSSGNFVQFERWRKGKSQ